MERVEKFLKGQGLGGGAMRALRILFYAWLVSGEISFRLNWRCEKKKIQAWRKWEAGRSEMGKKRKGYGAGGRGKK